MSRARLRAARLGAQSAAPAAYLAASALLWRQLLSGIGRQTYGGADAYLFVWWLRWMPFAVAHGHLPFRSGWLGYPDGVNAMWNTSVLLLGFLAWPVTMLAGPLVTFNVLLIAAPALSAFTCYLVAFDLFGSRMRAALAGLLYGFSPYFIGQSAGHLQMTWAVFPPLLVWFYTQILVRQQLPPARLGLALGLATGLQLLIGEELLASAALLALLTTLALVLMYRDEVRRRARYALAALSIAFMTAALIDALPLYVQLFGPQRVSGPVQSQAPGADLLSFVLPSPLQALHALGPLSGLQQRVVGSNLAEQTAYLGLPMLTLVFYAAVCSVRDHKRRLLLVPLAIAFVLTLGRSLSISGHPTGIPLPAAAAAHVPLLQSMLPVRFSQYVDLFSALLVASWIGRARGVRRYVQLALLAAGIATLMPLPLPAVAVTTPSFFTTPAGGGLLPDAAAFVAPYPGPGAPAPMLWQAMSGMRFRMMGGYFIGPDSDGHAVFGSPPGPTARLVSAIQNGHNYAVGDRRAEELVVQELTADRVDTVIVGPMPHEQQVVAFFAAVLRTPATRFGDVTLFRFRPARGSKRAGDP